MSKITYLLFLGTFLAVGALTYNIYQPLNIVEKKINVPVVDKIKEAKPLIKEDEKIDNVKSEKILNLQTIRVNPDGDVLIAGKTLPNSELNVIILLLPSKVNVLGPTGSLLLENLTFAKVDKFASADNDTDKLLFDIDTVVESMYRFATNTFDFSI